jgi:hypothetical protein
MSVSTMRLILLRTTMVGYRAHNTIGGSVYTTGEVAGPTQFLL